jgi:hypothetical protein
VRGFVVTADLEGLLDVGVGGAQGVNGGAVG